MSDTAWKTVSHVFVQSEGPEMFYEAPPGTRILTATIFPERSPRFKPEVWSQGGLCPKSIFSVPSEVQDIQMMKLLLTHCVSIHPWLRFSGLLWGWR